MRTRGTFANVVWISLAAHVALVLWFPHTPLVDWPNHMARHFLEYKAMLGEQVQGYRIVPHLTPNLGSDLVVPFLMFVLPPAWAGALFLALAVLGYWYGAVRFIRTASGAENATASAAAALLLPWLLYSAFFWGFINFYSGVGLSLLAASRAVDPRASRNWLWLVTQTAFALLLGVWHMTALLGYGVLIACHGLAELLRQTDAPTRLAVVKRMSPLVISAVPAFCLLAWMVVLRGGSPVGGGVVWSPPIRKFELLVGFFVGYQPLLDIATSLFWFAAIAVAFRIEALSLRRLAWPFWSVLAFLFLYCGLPFELGTTSGVDVRMLPFLLVSSLAGLATLPPRKLERAWPPLAIATSIRLASIVVAWFGISKTIESDLYALSSLPPGSKMLVAKAGAMSKSEPTIHLPGWGVVAGNVTPSSLFAIWGQQPMVSALPEPEYIWIRESPAGREEIVFPPAEITNSYDFVWLYNTANVPTSRPDGWERIYQRGEIDIWTRR